MCVCHEKFVLMYGLNLGLGVLILMNEILPNCMTKRGFCTIHATIGSDIDFGNYLGSKFVFTCWFTTFNCLAWIRVWFGPCCSGCVRNSV